MLTTKSAPTSSPRFATSLAAIAVTIALASISLVVVAPSVAEAQAACTGLEPGLIEVLVLDLPDDATWSIEPSYGVDERDLLGGSVGRVSYCLELDGDWMSATFDAPSFDPALLGVPVSEAATIRTREAITIRGNVAGVPTGDDLPGVIEFWPNSYATDRSLGVPGATSGVYDADDTRGGGRYGSMQVHLTDPAGGAAQTVLAYNRWATGGVDDVGFGTGPGAHPDWTFTGAAASASTKRLRVFASPRVGTLSDQGPVQTGAVVPRVGDAATALTSVRGDALRADRVRSRTLLDGALLHTHEAEIAVDGSFEVPVEVPAATASHVVTVEVRVDGQWTRIHTAADLVGGDLYLIQGQSNAVANVFGGGVGLEGLASPWIRTFGSASRTYTPDASSWTTAVAAVGYSIGSVGQWGMRVGADLLALNDVPVAVINGADGGKPASFFQRNDANPTDPLTNYGRFLRRVEAAGVDGAAPIVGWYQGESDASRPAEHQTMVTALFDDWAEQFAALSSIHLVQIHTGCGGSLTVREVQRQIALERPEVDLVSTVALPGHDGCHYVPAGYSQLGQQIALLTQRDIIGGAAPAGIDSPVAVSAELIGAERSTLRVHFAPADAQILVPSARDFSVSDSGVAIVEAAGGTGTIEFELNRRPVGGATFRYLGASAPYPTTPWGAALAAFDGLPIDQGPDPASPDCDGDLDLVDALMIARFGVGALADAGGCADGVASGQLHASAGDLDRDGETNARDAMLLLRCLSGASSAECENLLGQ